MGLQQPEREAMIDCYTWMTDNGYKPRMMLEECGLAHKIIPVNIREKAQMSPEYMKISPGHKIPAIVDHDGPGGATVTLCESGAILKYLVHQLDRRGHIDELSRLRLTNDHCHVTIVLRCFPSLILYPLSFV